MWAAPHNCGDCDWVGIGHGEDADDAEQDAMRLFREHAKAVHHQGQPRIFYGEVEHAHVETN